MHELSLMTQMFEVIDREIGMNGYQKILEVEIEVGDYLRAIDSQLETCFEALKRERDVTRQARLVIHHEQAIVRCRGCESEWEFAKKWYYCDRCGRSDPAILSGKELKIVSMEVDE